MKHIVAVIVLIVILTAAAIFGVVRPPQFGQTGLMPALASAEGAAVDLMFSLEMYLIAFLFALIIGFMLYSIVVFRRKKGDTSDGAYIHGNTALEIVWTVIPFGFVLFFGVFGTLKYSEIVRPKAGEFTIDITSRQWSWSFTYPDNGGFTSDVLKLPVDQTVLLRLEAVDVIHSFWVPEFRVKQDAIPGMTTELRITPTQLGTYKLRCAELCGLDHAAMIAGVEVVSREAFDAWTAQMAVAAAAATTPEAIGERLYTEAGCVACHSIDGSAGVGPTWLGLLGRTENLDDGSTVTVDEAYLRASILNPGEQIVSGFTNVMPANIAADMTAEQIDALIAYIQTLESGN